MRELGLAGATRGGRKIRTTIADPAADRAPDLLNRAFVAPAPNRVWVADFTYVPTHTGTVYVAFVIDTYSRRIVGWSAATSKATPLVLAALEMGLWQRDRAGEPRNGLIHHSDAGSQYTSFGSPPTWPSKASPPPSAQSATPTTTRSWNQLSACSKPS